MRVARAPEGHGGRRACGTRSCETAAVPPRRRPRAGPARPCRSTAPPVDVTLEEDGDPIVGDASSTARAASTNQRVHASRLIPAISATSGSDVTTLQPLEASARAQPRESLGVVHFAPRRHEPDDFSGS